MRRLILFLALFSFAGAVAAWCYAFLRGPMFLSEAVVAVRAPEFSNEGAAEMRGRMLDKTVLIDAARNAGGSIAAMSSDDLPRRARADVLDERRIRVGFVAGDPQSAEAFVRSWIGCFPNTGGSEAGPDPQKEAEALAGKLREQEAALRRSEASMRGFLCNDAGLSPAHADAIIARLGRGDSLADIVAEDRMRIARQQLDAEAQIRKLEAKEQSLLKALEGEERYIITYQLKEENPIARDLRQQLAEKQMQLQRLKVDSTMKHPLRARLEQEITKIEELLKDKPLESVKEQRREINPVYKDISLELSRTRREADALRGEIALSRESAEAVHGKLSRFMSDEGRPDSVLGGYRAQMRSVRDVRALMQQAAVRAAPGTFETGLEILSISSPAVPLNPALRMRMLILLGALGGAVIGVLAWAAAPMLRGRPFSPYS